MAFAIVETGGKQYKVAAGQKLKVEKLEAAPGASLMLDKVLLVADGDSVQVGVPYVAGAKVAAQVVGSGREDTKIVFKYHSKTRQRKKKGHRQPYTELQVVSIK